MIIYGINIYKIVDIDWEIIKMSGCEIWGLIICGN